MIKYDETIQVGFERKNLGNDNVWFKEFGYEWFITEKIILKKGKFKIIANWCPDVKKIDVLHVQEARVIARRIFNDIESYKEFESFFIPKPKH